MKFEEHIKGNKKTLGHSAPNKGEMWDNIESQIPQQKPRFSSKWIVSMAASFLIIGMIYLFAYQVKKDQKLDDTQNELIALKQKINGLMSQRTTSSRILAVSMTEEAGINDLDIINTLIDRMCHDESTNVRIAAIRALEPHTENEIVRVAMIEELANSKNQYIQINLMNILSDANDKRVEPYLDSIIDKAPDQSILYNEAFDNKAILKEI